MKKTRDKIFGKRVLLAFGLFPSICFAAAPVYFDLGGLIRYSLLYIVGFIVVVALAIQSKGSPKYTVLLLAYLIAPFILIGASLKKSERDTKAANEKIAAQIKTNTEFAQREFSALCKERRRIIHAKVGSRPAVLVVRINTREFPEPDYQYQGATLAGLIRENKKECDKSTSVTIEEFSARYENGKTVAPEIRHHDTCEKNHWTVREATSANYALLLGENTHRVQSPIKEIWSPWSVQTSSARIIRLSDQKTLAEDTLYFSDYVKSGDCTDPKKQVVELIGDVFD